MDGWMRKGEGEREGVKQVKGAKSKMGRRGRWRENGGH